MIILMEIYQKKMNNTNLMHKHMHCGAIDYVLMPWYCLHDLFWLSIDAFMYYLMQIIIVWLQNIYSSYVCLCISYLLLMLMFGSKVAFSFVVLEGLTFDNRILIRRKMSVLLQLYDSLIGLMQNYIINRFINVFWVPTWITNVELTLKGNQMRNNLPSTATFLPQDWWRKRCFGLLLCICE